MIMRWLGWVVCGCESVSMWGCVGMCVRAWSWMRVGVSERVCVVVTVGGDSGC